MNKRVRKRIVLAGGGLFIIVAIGVILPAFGKARQWTGWMPYYQIRELGFYASGIYRDREELPGSEWPGLWTEISGEVESGSRYHADKLRRHYFYIHPSHWRDSADTGWPEGPGEFPMFYEHIGLVRFSTGVAYWDGESERMSDDEFDAMLAALEAVAGKQFRPHEKVLLSSEEIETWWGHYPYRP